MDINLSLRKDKSLNHTIAIELQKQRYNLIFGPWNGLWWGWLDFLDASLFQASVLDTYVGSLFVFMVSLYYYHLSWILGRRIRLLYFLSLLKQNKYKYKVFRRPTNQWRKKYHDINNTFMCDTQPILQKIWRKSNNHPWKTEREG